MKPAEASKIIRGLVAVDKLRLLNPEIAALTQAADDLDAIAAAQPVTVTREALRQALYRWEADGDCGLDEFAALIGIEVTNG